MYGKNVRLIHDDTMALRLKNFNHGLVLSSSYLVPDQVFEVCISEFAPQWAGSLRIGVTTLQGNVPSMFREDLPASIFDIPEDTWFVVGSQVRHNKSLLKLHFCPSLDWLLPGDRVGVMLTSDYSLRLLVNSEDMGVAVTTLPRKVYVVIDLFGRTKSVKISNGYRPVPGVGGVQPISATLAATSPGQTSLRSSRLQDSLELLGVRSPLSPVLPGTLLPPLALPSTQQTSQQEQQQPLPVPVVSRTSCFHERHGRNIQLDSSRTIAQRTASYNQGLIVGENHLVQNILFQVRIDRVAKHWTSSLLCGVTAQLPDTMTFPVTALGLKKNTWVICSDGVFHNGIKIRAMYGPDWERIGESHLLGLLLDSKSRLHLFVDGEDQGVAATDIPYPCYPIIDVYGQCEQVTLVGPETAHKSRGGSEKEKAELEDDEKGSMSPNYSNAEDHSSNSSTSSHEPSVLLAATNPTAQCDHIQACLTFKAAIGLPDGFFLGVGPGFVQCFCAACDNKSKTVISGGSVDERSCDVLEHGDPPNEYWRPRGWCSFALRRPEKPPDAHDSCSNWHIAYCPTNLANLRKILDQSALLMPAKIQTDVNREDQPGSAMPVHVFHSRCGGRVVLNATNTSAHRNPSDFNCGLVFSGQPLTPDQLFEVRIDKKISSWSGSIEMGVTACDPATFDLPSSATDLREGSWIMSGNSILRDGRSVVETGKS
ncbi:hypothetical protein B566_EDAN001015 [Ephemera danica]|nr:hypothetical protein B566_EDAN001015 [Ephemera danica]